VVVLIYARVIASAATAQEKITQLNFFLARSHVMRCESLELLTWMREEVLDSIQQSILRQFGKYPNEPEERGSRRLPGNSTAWMSSRWIVGLSITSLERKLLMAKPD
jgi:hypothetical protein